MTSIHLFRNNRVLFIFPILLVPLMAFGQNAKDSLSIKRSGSRIRTDFMAIGGLSYTTLNFTPQPGTSFFVNRASFSPSTKGMFGVGFRFSYGNLVWNNDITTRRYVIKGHLDETVPVFNVHREIDYELTYKYIKFNSGIFLKGRNAKVGPYIGAGLSWGNALTHKPDQHHVISQDGSIIEQGNATAFTPAKSEFGFWFGAGYTWKCLFAETRLEFGSGPEKDVELDAKTRYFMLLAGARFQLKKEYFKEYKG